MIGWTLLKYDGWQLYVAASAKGLCYLGNGSYADLVAWVQRHFAGAQLQPAALEPYVSELTEYLQGRRQAFAVPLDLRGTPFQLQVWETLCHIPYGETVAYSDIAAQIGRPTAVRAVGGAIGSNPVSIVVPCHRVVGKDGSLTGYGGGLPMKKRLLALERGLVAL